MPFSFGMPEAVMSNLRVHPQLESRYNALGDLSNPDGWLRRVNVYESSFNRTNLEPIYRRSNWSWDALNANALQYITRNSIYQGCVRYGTYRGVPAVYTPGNTGTGHFGEFGTASIPVPETWVSSVRRQYRYRKLR